MAKSNWKAFPHADNAYDYAGANLKKNWDRLHAGDREPFPDIAYLRRRSPRTRKLKPARIWRPAPKPCRTPGAPIIAAISARRSKAPTRSA